jgi:hypothetical protein
MQDDNGIKSKAYLFVGETDREKKLKYVIGAYTFHG